MMAVISAARCSAQAHSGVRVTLIEQLSRPGVKLLATGGGRCNLSNTLSTAEYLVRLGSRGRFTGASLKALSAGALRDFFREIGVETYSPDGFLVFPVSNSASDVRSALEKELRRLDVEILTGTTARRLLVEDGAIVGIETGDGPLPTCRVILATGGKSYPKLGGTAAGFDLAAQVGHEIVPPVPALVPIITVEKWPGECAGISIPEAEIWIEKAVLKSSRGTGGLLFTHSGISGPAVLDISGEVAARVQSGKTVKLSFKLSRFGSADDWRNILSLFRCQGGARPVSMCLSKMLPARLAEALCRAYGLPPDLRAAYLTRKQTQSFASFLAAVPLTAAGTEGFDKAMVTRGGVKLDVVDPLTLESRVARGLFFAGEVLDIDGPCGGFNLQWAFSSGYLAGKSAASGMNG